MSELVIVAIIGFFGTAVGSICGVLASSKLTAYRIEQLEKQVNKHNCLVERMYKAEQRIAILEEVVQNE